MAQRRERATLPPATTSRVRLSMSIASNDSCGTHRGATTSVGAPRVFFDSSDLSAELVEVKLGHDIGTVGKALRDFLSVQMVDKEADRHLAAHRRLLL